jgi:hypothetical protein
MRWKFLGAVGACLLVAACETAPTYNPGTAQSISIPYDPYSYDPDELFEQADSHCSAYGKRAVYVDETIDPNSVRWRYRHYDCV